MLTVEELVYKMLTTNTWSALWDSGDAYGRHRERNQHKSLKDFKDEQPVKAEIVHYKYDGKSDSETKVIGTTEHRTHHLDPQEDRQDHSEYSYTISVFHYLTKWGLELNELCHQFNSMGNEDWNSEIYGVSAKQEERLKQMWFDIGDSFNTCNGESGLSQVLQWTYVSNWTDKYVLLQVHQWCDVRGGYTDAYMFYLPEDWMPSEDVGWEIVMNNGDVVRVSSTYNWYSLTYDDDDQTNPLYKMYTDVDPIDAAELKLFIR